MAQKLTTALAALTIAAIPTASAFAQGNSGNSATIMVGGVVDAVNVSGAAGTITINVAMVPCCH